ncbi:MAG: hypothetical protein GXP56_11930 [Deltaproteobacteria bacterium]|nr:hypothetical protein [Deltaproteobacteria bacterium]
MFSNLKQVVADIMAADHTSGVPLETGNAFTRPPRLHQTGDMRTIKTKF